MVSQDQKSRTESRQRILETAQAVFAEKGFDGARVDEIAQRAGVNKALIYYYFKSKDELLQEILRTFLEARRTSRPKQPSQEGVSLPEQIARFDVDFLYGQRDILRIAMMEDLRSSKERSAGNGTILRQWLEGLAEARKEYQAAGYGFRYTPRVVTAMYFFHMLPIVTFCAMGETLAKEIGTDFETVRKEFLQLAIELERNHFHPVFGASVTDPSPEVSLPGLVPVPPSSAMLRVQEILGDDLPRTEAEIEAILAGIVDAPKALLRKLLDFRYFTPHAGKLRWSFPQAASGAPIPARQAPPQAHLHITAEERTALVAKHMPKGRLEKFPLKEKARVAVIEHLAVTFQAGSVYSEKEVDALLKPLAADHAKARRYLVDYGFLKRTADGSRYWTWDTSEP